MSCHVHGPFAPCRCEYARKPATLIALVALVVGCSSAPSLLPASDPCSLENPARLAFVLDCDEKIDKCPRMPDGTARADCPALVECEKQQAKECG